MNKKILVITLNYDNEVVGGGKKSLSLVLKGLVSNDFTSYVFTLGKQNEVYRKSGLIIIRKKKMLPTKAFSKLLWHFLDVFNLKYYVLTRKLIKKIKPDLIYTNIITGFSPTVWLAAKHENVKVLHTLRDYYLLCIRSSLFRKSENCSIERCTSCRLRTLINPWFTKKVDSVVGNSKFILDKHLEYGLFTGVSSTYIYNSTPFQNRIPIRKSKEQLIIGFLGVIDTHKGIEELLKLVTVKEIDKIIIGGKIKREKYEVLKNNSKIEYKGIVNPKEFFKDIELLVVPSLWHDPLPRTIYESYSFGIPVLTTTRGGCPEIVEEDTGLTYDPIKENIKDAFYRYLEKRGEYNSKKIQNYSKKFLPENTIKSYENVIYGILGGKNDGDLIDENSLENY